MRQFESLLTSIGSLSAELADPASQNALREFLQTHPVWMPTESRSEPLLRRKFLEAFDAVVAKELVFVPEFPTPHPVVRLPIAEFNGGSILPGCGTLLAPDASFPFTAEWDSFLTLFLPKGVRGPAPRCAAV